MSERRFFHSTHWGAFEAVVGPQGLRGIEAFGPDPAPPPQHGNIASALRHATRIERPMVRRGWLERGPGADAARGSEPFVPLDWDRALDLLGAELRRVYEGFGGAAVYGGSYGWASAGRFHHAQSQLHRFLNCLGGYVRKENNYSFGASEVLLPHVVGGEAYRDVLKRNTSWDVLAEHAELVVAFGGMPLKNTYVTAGGASTHPVPGYLRAMRERGCRFVLASPIRDDLAEAVDAEWLALRPGTDTALMLALAWVLRTEGLHDEAFLASHCSGYERFERHLLGVDDGQPKSPRWAEAICEIPAATIADLARRMAGRRTFVSTTWSLQRARHGEQPLWMSIVLAAMLGQVGLPGGGFGHGHGSAGEMGWPLYGPLPTLPQGTNRVDRFIPVARIADMLLAPGASYEYDGRTLTYPDIRLVYWCGGNPFHHHQDLARLERAFQRPQTVVVHDTHWTASARRADFVIPIAATLERNDIGAANSDRWVIAMRQALAPYGQARSDYAVFSSLAERLGIAAEFTEGRDEMAWLRHLYDGWRMRLAGAGCEIPAFDRFWEEGCFELPYASRPTILLEDFRRDPQAHALRTPSGRIEIASETIAGFGYDDCPRHPSWLGSEADGDEAQWPLVLVANQPASRLHSQLDVGDHSRSTKVNGREPMRMHPDDAAARGLRDGDVALVQSAQGACLAGVVLSTALRRGVVQLSTGAWYDPQEVAGIGRVCVHGNPNALTRDRGTSRLAQGPTGQLTRVQVVRFEGPLPELSVLRPPPFVAG